MKRVGPPPWSVPVAIHQVPETGRQFQLAADAGTRAAIARAVGLRDLSRLAANFEVSRHGRGGLRVVGDIAATVTQDCVVTLEPVESDVNETVDLLFLPPAARTDLAGAVTDDNMIAPDEAPEPLIGGAIDLGAVATEFLTLGLDPYPRKPGATFDVPATADDSEHPFAALAALKKGQGGDGR